MTKHEVLDIILSFHDRCPLGSGRHRVKKLLDCLLDLLTFSYSQTRGRDIFMEGNELEELEEVKKLWKAILELG